MKQKFNLLTTILIASAILLALAVGALLFLLIGKPFSRHPIAERIHIAAITPIPTATPTEVPSPTPSPSCTPVPTAVPTPSGLIGGKYDVFSYADDPVMTKESYRSDTVSITVTKYSGHPYQNSKLVYFVADIYLQDISSLRTAASSTFDKRGAKAIDRLSKNAGALLAINGDYYTAISSTYLLRNGELFRSSKHPTRDVLILRKDGSVEVFDGPTFDPDMDMTDVWQVWQFGPYLIDEDGNPKTEFPHYGFTIRNPRTVFGYYEPGHYCFVVVDGRQGGYSVGITMSDLARLMKDLGCTQAYNLDGGASSQLYWNGKLWNQPSGDGLRSIPDIIYIAEPVYDAAPQATPVPVHYKGSLPTLAPTAEPIETE